MANAAMIIKIKIQMSILTCIKWRILGFHKKNISMKQVGSVADIKIEEIK